MSLKVKVKLTTNVEYAMHGKPAGRDAAKSTKKFLESYAGREIEILLPPVPASDPRAHLFTCGTPWLWLSADDTSYGYCQHQLEMD